MPTLIAHRDSLSTLIDRAGYAVSPSSATPLFAAVRLVVGETGLTVRATNGDRWFEGETAMMTTRGREPFDVHVGYSDLRTAVGHCADAEVELAFEEGRLRVGDRGGRLTIDAPHVNPDHVAQFSRIAEPAGYGVMTGAELRRAYDAVDKSCDRRDPRGQNCFKLEAVAEGVWFVAAERSRRLAFTLAACGEVRHDAEGCKADASAFGDAIRAMAPKGGDAFRVAWDRRRFEVAYPEGNSVLCGPLVEGGFVPWRSIRDDATEPACRVKLDRNAFVLATKRCLAAVGGELSPASRVIVDESGVHVRSARSANATLKKCSLRSDALIVPRERTGSIDLGMNVAMMKDAAEADRGDVVTIDFNATGRPALFRVGRTTTAVMPMMIPAGT